MNMLRARRLSVGMSLLLSPLCFALPVGHEASVLGNTTARVGEIGAAVDFPSVLAFDPITGTRLFSGLAFTDTQISSQSGSEINTRRHLVPYFSGSLSEIQGLRVASYLAYSSDLVGSASVSESSLGIRGTADFFTDLASAGVSAGMLLKDSWSLGGGFSLLIENNQSYFSATGKVGADNFLLSQSTKENVTGLQVNFGMSRILNNSLLSASLKSPALIVSKSGEETTKILIENSAPYSRVAAFTPSIAHPWGIALGWNRKIHERVELTFDAHIDFPQTYRRTVGADPQDTTEVFRKTNWSLKIGSEYDLGGGSLMGGIRYQDRADDITSENEHSSLRAFSLGWHFQNAKSHPVLGLFYEDVRSLSRTMGVLYSTNFNI